MKQGKSLVKGHNSDEHDWSDDVLVFSIVVYLLVKLYGHLHSIASLIHFKSV